jgi:hypothetical protein
MRIGRLWLVLCGGCLLLASDQGALAQGHATTRPPVTDRIGPGIDNRIPGKTGDRWGLGNSGAQSYEESQSYGGSAGYSSPLYFDHTRIMPAEGARAQWHYGRAGHF